MKTGIHINPIANLGNKMKVERKVLFLKCVVKLPKRFAFRVDFPIWIFGSYNVNRSIIVSTQKQ